MLVYQRVSWMFIPSNMVIGMVLTHPNWFFVCVSSLEIPKRWLWGYSGNNSVMHPFFQSNVAQKRLETARKVLFWSPSGEMFLDDGFILPLNMVKHRIMQEGQDMSPLRVLSIHLHAILIAMVYRHQYLNDKSPHGQTSRTSQQQGNNIIQWLYAHVCCVSRVWWHM